jgi:hypothetical protein
LPDPSRRRKVALPPTAPTPESPKAQAKANEIHPLRMDRSAYLLIARLPDGRMRPAPTSVAGDDNP